MISVVIPALNAASSLPACLAAVRSGAGEVGEIVVVDGGSSDSTTEVATAAGARVIEAPRGRGSQLRAGAAAATGGWLLFLHADTALGAGWHAAARSFVGGSRNERRAAAFRFALDDRSRAARRLERLVAWRVRKLGLPYGDQGLLISRRLYDAVGGFRPVPLMEDVDIIRRIGRSNVVELPVPAVTSAGRYRREGYWLRPARNLFCLALYFAGVPPEMIRRVYG